MLIPEQFAGAPVYDLLTAAAEGRVGLDQRWLRAILDRGEDAIPDIIRFGREPLEEFPVSVDEEILMILRHLKSPASVPFFVEYLRRYGHDVPDAFVDAILPVREAALEPLIQLYEELEEDQAGEVAFCLAAFRIRDDRVLRILTERLEYDVVEGAIALSLYGDPAARPAVEAMMAGVDDVHLKNQLVQTMEDFTEQAAPPEEDPFDIWEEFPEKAGPDPAVLQPADLLDMLEAADPEYRIAGAAGFVNHDIPADVRQVLLNHARTDESVEVRAKCWEVLSEIVSEDEEVYREMVARLRDESVPLVERAGALKGLGPRADQKEVRPFAEKFYENPATRAAAMNAMWNSLDRAYSKYFPPHIDDTDPDVRRQALSGIGYLAIHDSAEKLKKYFGDEDWRPNALYAYALAVRAEISPARVRSLLRKIEEAAQGFSEEEKALVEMALDERLMLNGYKPVFAPHEDDGGNHHHEHAEGATPAPAKSAKPGRNDPCPCGSGKKYKKCCGA